MTSTEAFPYTAAVLHAMAAYTRRSLVADIHGQCLPVKVAGEGDTRWWDLRTMLSEHEHCPEVRDMTEQALALAFALDVIRAHPQQPHLVRIVGDSA